MAADAVKRWKFAALGPEGDTVLHAEVQETSFWTLGNGTVFPFLKATITLISTVDDDQLGVACYSIRSDADGFNPRSLRPRAEDRFTGLDPLFADPARAAASLYANGR